ncbi:MAG TPA: CPBP family intramembrane metalloprotease [Thauera sp.]|nr:CPBP family intramembrane metalloprotease [Xanthomonadales bacterium]HQZ02232.1 CPBP family intramembrane metalloprotease [Thauera sp.]
MGMIFVSADKSRTPKMSHEDIQAPPSPHVYWRSIVTFYALACAWSWPFFWLRDFHTQAFYSLPCPGFLKTSLIMWGPGLAALVCWRLFRDRWPRRTNILGGHPWRALAFYFLPMAALAIPGIPMQPGTPPVHVLVFLLAIVGLFNTLGEELGWRGFLQDALRPLVWWKRFGLVGAMWCGWHFTNLFAGRDTHEMLAYLAWYPLSCVLLSSLLGMAVERSRAVLVSVTLHAWVNMLFEFSGTGTTLVFACAIPFWIWMLWSWPTRISEFHTPRLVQSHRTIDEKRSVI